MPTAATTAAESSLIDSGERNGRTSTKKPVPVVPPMGSTLIGQRTVLDARRSRLGRTLGNRNATPIAIDSSLSDSAATLKALAPSNSLRYSLMAAFDDTAQSRIPAAQPGTARIARILGVG